MDISEQEGTVGRWISVLYRHAQAYMAKHLKPYKIGSGQFAFLYVLDRNNGINQDSLAEILDIDKATTARAIAKLESEGYVKRVINQEDKRALRIYITAKTQETMPYIRKAMLEWNELITSGLDEDEKSMALKLLHKMAINASKIKGRKP